MIKKESATHLVKRGLHYVTVCSEVVDQISTPEALAIWVYLMSKSEGWIIRREDIKTRFKLGEDRLRRAMRELRDLGLIWDFTITGDDKKILSKRLVCESLPSTANDALLSDFPQLGKTHNEENPQCGKPDAYIKESIITKESSNTKESNITSADASCVFDYWKMRMGKSGNAKLTSGRKAKINARIKEGYSVDQIKQAIDGCAKSPHHMGQNGTGNVYDDLTLICRNGEKLEWFINNIGKVAPNEQTTDQPARSSMLDRVKQHSEQRKAQRARELDSGGGYGGGVVAPAGGNVRPQVHQPVRGVAGRHMGALPDGDNRAAEAEWVEVVPR